MSREWQCHSRQWWLLGMSPVSVGSCSFRGPYVGTECPALPSHPRPWLPELSCGQVLGWGSKEESRESKRGIGVE